MLRTMVIGLGLLGCLGGGKLRELAGQETIASAEILDLAAKLLPIEDRYDYHRTFLDGSIHLLRRSPEAQPRGDELSIEGEGWEIWVGDDEAPLTRFASQDMVDFFHRSMQVRVTKKEVASLRGWKQYSKKIIAGTIGQFSPTDADSEGLGGALTKSKDYEIRVGDRQICVCGWDDAGVMHGLFHLQRLMTLREGPFLPVGLRTVRHSRYQTRMVLSWLGWMQWPDNYLSHLAHDGYDAIYASVYANPNGVEGPPHYDLIRKQDGAKLRELIERASKYGIRVYAAIMYANTGEEENQLKLREHVRDIVSQFPGIRGYVLLTEGFFYKEFFGAGAKTDQDLDEWSRRWTEAVGIVSEECHRIDPTIEVLPWEYNIDFRPERVELKRKIVGLLPRDTIPLLTWENGKEFEIDGLRGYLRDYSISQVGPAEVAVAQIAEAKRRGMKVYCKADCYATWQFGTIPYLPCAQQWQRRYAALADYGVDGTLESWSNGYKPNIIAELRCWSSWTDAMPDDELLDHVARRVFGREGASQAVRAWEHFSRAIQLVPDTGPSMGTNNAVAHPLFFREPPPRIMTLHNSWWDEAKKTPWRHRMEEAWPYCHRMMVFLPDFSNRRNQAESYARSRSGIGNTAASSKIGSNPVLPTFLQYVCKAADEMEMGLQFYRRAAWNAPAVKQAGALKEVLIAEQMARMLRSLYAILDFEDHRLRLHTTKEVTQTEAILDAMTSIANDELARTKEAYRTAQLDSRLGYECEMDYVYSPLVIEEKIQMLEKTIASEIPAFRNSLRKAKP